MFFIADISWRVPALAGTVFSGSRVVQIALTLAFFALMFVMARRGYWRGPVRQIAPLCSIAIAVCVAWFFGSAFGHAWLGLVGVPWILRGAAGGVLLCLFVWLPIYSFLWYCGRGQVSEKTGEPEHPVLGAVVGCWTAVFWSAFALFCIVVAGTLGETYLALRPGAEKSFVGRMLSWAAIAKNSAALYPRFEFLKNWTPLPEASARVVGKALDVLGSRAAQQRLLQMPEIRSLVTDPAVYPVLADPEIQRMLDACDVDALLSDARVKRMLYDENFQRRIAALEVEPLLDYALSGVPATSVPADSK